ncbi:MAG: hypothetical protein FWH42_02565 [Dehalococcoidia bacterium]|nr:hypothetical protein [Dehalococcoidia bacterium]
MNEEKHKITFEQVEREFSPDDLKRYKVLCRGFFGIIKGKKAHELWDMAQPGQKLRKTLDEMSEIRSRYDFLKGQKFFRVWVPNMEEHRMDEMVWY